MSEEPESSADSTASSNDRQEVVITTGPGPFIRMATLCESVIEEAGTHTTTIVRMMDAVHYSRDEVAHGDTGLPGVVAFMGYNFPADEEAVNVTILIATDEGDVIGMHERTMHLQGPLRSFAIATHLGGLQIPRPGLYVFALAYQHHELARAYLRVTFETDDPRNEAPGAT